MSKESTTTSVICDANKLPEEIKTKAHEYVAKRKPRFKTFGIVSDDVEDAWLNGFAFCLEGLVEVKVKRCATCVYTDSPCTPSDYIKGAEDECAHYKSVFEENADLQKSHQDLYNSMRVIKDQRNKAKEIIKDLLKLPYSSNEEAFADVNSYLDRAEQFLKDIEVEQ